MIGTGYFKLVVPFLPSHIIVKLIKNKQEVRPQFGYLYSALNIHSSNRCEFSSDTLRSMMNCMSCHVV